MTSYFSSYLPFRYPSAKSVSGSPSCVHSATSPSYGPGVDEDQPLLLQQGRQTSANSLSRTSSVSANSDAGDDCDQRERQFAAGKDRAFTFAVLPDQIKLSDRTNKNADLSECDGKKHATWHSIIDLGAFQFATRMALLLTASGLFVLMRIPTTATEKGWRHYPDGMWVLVSVLFVCWFPNLDAASVLEKITQRLIGTFVGALLGLSCGFTSLAIFRSNLVLNKPENNSIHSPAYLHQASFLTVCMFVVNFGIIFLAGHCKVGGKKVIRRYAYATILCVLTFCICMLPFGLEEDPKWRLGVWRVCNVIVGCILGAVGSMVVCPKSTTDVLYEKTARQVKLAGEAGEAVLHLAAQLFAGKVKVKRLCDELLDAPLESTLRWKINRMNSDAKLSDASSPSTDGTNNTRRTISDDADVALKKYEDAIADWNLSKALFPLAKFDPFYKLGSRRTTRRRRSSYQNDPQTGVVSEPSQQKQRQSQYFHAEIAKTLARSLRIQTTIVVLDGMVRSETDLKFEQSDLDMFYSTGTMIRQMLTLPFQVHVNDAAAVQLLDQLQWTRTKIMEISKAVAEPEPAERDLRDQEFADFKAALQQSQDGFSSSRDILYDDDDLGRGIPKFASGCNDNTLFFLQLVEHLTLRSLRLFQAWRNVERIPCSPSYIQDGKHHDDRARARQQSRTTSDELNSVHSILGF